MLVVGQDKSEMQISSVFLTSGRVWTDPVGCLCRYPGDIASWIWYQ